jgi:hypothetical protein
MPDQMTDIYRIVAPVGTCEHDIEWITVEVLVGTYDDAYNAAMFHNPCSSIEFLDGPNNMWIEA